MPFDTGNYPTCVSVDEACGGYDYSFDIENVCRNSTYYGTCNFAGVTMYWYDIYRNLLFVTGENLSIPQGQTITVHGDWANEAPPALNDLSFLEISTTGGWAAATMSVNS